MSKEENLIHDDGWFTQRSDHVSGDQQFGPCSRIEMARWISEGRIIESDLIWVPGLNRWTTVTETLNLLLPAASLSPRTMPRSSIAAQSQDKSGVAKSTPYSSSSVERATLKDPVGAAGNSFAKSPADGPAARFDDLGAVAESNSSTRDKANQDKTTALTAVGTLAIPDTDIDDHQAPGKDKVKSTSAEAEDDSASVNERTSPANANARTRMRGTIKSISIKGSIRDFTGIIEAENDGLQLTFRSYAFKDNKCAIRMMVGAQVEFDVVDIDGNSKSIATNLRGLKFRELSDSERSPSRLSLFEWATGFYRKHKHNNKWYDNAFAALKEIARDEPWDLGSEGQRQPFSLLASYLDATFKRASSPSQNKLKIKESGGQYWALFNTGLVDRWFNSIYILFVEDERFVWRLSQIAVPTRGDGRQLLKIFDQHEFPDPNRYFDKGDEVVMLLKDPSKPIPFREEHIIDDAIANNRYPPEFLERFCPEDFTWDSDYEKLDKHKRNRFLESYAKAIKNDDTAYLEFKRAIEQAIVQAQRRTTWNFKTAIPGYYPRHDKMQLYLPLSLDHRDEKKVSVALIVNRHPSGAYEGFTVYPLEWAYKHARVVCKPDSDWLKPEEIMAAFDDDDDENDDDET